MPDWIDIAYWAMDTSTAMEEWGAALIVVIVIVYACWITYEVYSKDSYE